MFSIHRSTHVTGYVLGKIHLIKTAIHVLSVMHAKQHKSANYVLICLIITRTYKDIQAKSGFTHLAPFRY
jgi:hypothetical protein